MKAAYYYIGRKTFVSKSGKDCFMVSMVVPTGASAWTVVDKFVEKPIYDDCATLQAGAAVDLVVDVARGSICAVELSSEFCPLPLGAEIA